MRALDWFVSGSETYAREPSQRLAQSPVAIFGTNMFPGRRPTSCRAPECGPLEALFSLLLQKIMVCQNRMHGLFPRREEPQTRNAGHTYMHTKIYGQISTGNK